MAHDKNRKNAHSHLHAQNKKNTRVLVVIFAVVIGMVGMSFAAVPLYNLFCKVTGYGGTTATAVKAPDDADVIDRVVTVRFNTNIARDLPWSFEPDEDSVRVKIGQKKLVSYTAHNKTARPTAGAAIYNITPLKAGKYFHKIQCFCFDEQVLGGGESVNMPVLFYVDPAMNDDPALDEVSTITLSYNFFKTESEALDQALEAFYNQPSNIKAGPQDSRSE